ncbi:MAG: hypothetical protein P8Q14_00680 [Vicingaceae bacterium]|nr:hypothetical protein [Vicingaceae bacterium]
MKKLLSFAVIILLMSCVSCTEKKSYYEQFKKNKTFVSRILDLNKTFNEIRTEEKGKLIKEDISFLKFIYDIGENDTYVVSYLFDEKGCYEIGIDGYFEFEKDALDVLSGIQKEMETAAYKKEVDDNRLNRWKNADKSISIELDHKGTENGLFVATIFANE